MECAVCCQAFTGLARKKINCRFCDFKACAQCHERYLLDTEQDPHCMNCRKGWPRELLLELFTKKFIDSVYKNRRETLLMEREKARLPETQPLAIKEKRIRDFNKLIDQVNLEIEGINIARLEISNGPLEGKSPRVDEMIERHEKALPFQNLVSEKMNLINHYKYCIEIVSNHFRTRDVERKFVRACPAPDCRGFLSTAWKCGICNLWTCPTCHELKGPEKDSNHTCDPNNVQTAALLEKDSRPCPNCASLIFKISGCDQMWCTSCKVPFSWSRGVVLKTEAIHNPHYYDFMRNQGGAFPDGPGPPMNQGACGGIPSVREVNDYCRMKPEHSILLTIHRIHSHIEYVILPLWQEGNYRNTNEQLRVKFILGDIDEAYLKKTLQRREKDRLKKADVHQILSMYQMVTRDLLVKFIREKGGDIEEFKQLRLYTNEHLSRAARVWNCHVPRILENYAVL